MFLNRRESEKMVVICRFSEAAFTSFLIKGPLFKLFNIFLPFSPLLHHHNLHSESKVSHFEKLVQVTCRALSFLPKRSGFLHDKKEKVRNAKKYLNLTFHAKCTLKYRTKSHLR